MSDTKPATTGQISARMSRQRRRDTAPEVALRKILHAHGRRFRKEYPVPGLPRRRVDIAFTKARIAVLVDGCFWHVCPEHATAPANNEAWWADKLRRNQQRDRETDEHLRHIGWTVLRVWEHEDPVEAVERIEAALDNSAWSRKAARGTHDD